MGLREKKAQRNRERIVGEALTLFSRDGYEQTTMESIAEAAEISPSTLYRYFPSKDMIVLARLTANSEKLVSVFASSSMRHPVAEALADAIVSVLQNEDEHAEETLLVRSIIDKSPHARARLWDHLYEEFNQVAEVLAERMNAAKDDLRVVLTARLAFTIMGTAADIWRANGGTRSSRSIAEEAMRLFREQGVVVPCPPQDKP